MIIAAKHYSYGNATGERRKQTQRVLSYSVGQPTVKPSPTFYNHAILLTSTLCVRRYMYVRTQFLRLLGWRGWLAEWMHGWMQMGEKIPFIIKVLLFSALLSCVQSFLLHRAALLTPCSQHDTQKSSPCLIMTITIGRAPRITALYAMQLTLVITKNEYMTNVYFLQSLAGVFYNVKNVSSFITSKNLSENLSNQNKHFWHFNSRFVLKTTKTQVFVMITY